MIHPITGQALSKEDVDLLDKHIYALMTGEYGEEARKELGDDILSQRETVLEKNPYLIEELQEASLDSKNSFLKDAPTFFKITPERKLTYEGRMGEKPKDTDRSV